MLWGRMTVWVAGSGECYLVEAEDSLARWEERLDRRSVERLPFRRPSMRPLSC